MYSLQSGGVYIFLKVKSFFRIPCPTKLNSMAVSEKISGPGAVNKNISFTISAK